MAPMKTSFVLSILFGIVMFVQGQNLRLRQALQSSNWLNDVDGDNIPGQAGVDYPVHASVPAGTSFRCKDYEYAGYFGDIEADCQAYHVCFPDGRNASFLCVNGTVFHQRYFVCDWWFHFNCSHAPSLYELNLFRKIPLPVLPPVQRRQFPGPIPQPKADILPTPLLPQREPKKLGFDPFEKDKKTEKDRKSKENRKLQNEYPRSDNKLQNPPSRGRDTPENKWKNPLEKRTDDERCECKCNSNPATTFISPNVQYT